MESRINFVAVDMPTANRLTVHILAAVAEEEARAISARTKAALVSAETRALKLGRHGAKLNKLNAATARKMAHELQPVVDSLRKGGVITLRGIADALNARRIKTPQGKRWHATSVNRLISRIDSLRSA